MRVMHAAPEPEASFSVGRVGTCMETTIFCFTVVGKCSLCLEFPALCRFVCLTERDLFTLTPSQVVVVVVLAACSRVPGGPTPGLQEVAKIMQPFFFSLHFKS